MKTAEKNKALQRRIKQQVAGRLRDFFIATAPGMEQVCLTELNNLAIDIGDLAAIAGGVGFRGRLKHSYLANLHLRAANRILMRMTAFRASNFKQLELKLSDFPWELYLNAGIPLHVKVTTRKSRLYHKTAIKERVETCITKHLARRGSPENTASNHHEHQTIHVRAENDRFTISIDSSGEILHKRGIRKTRALAPIRENIGAAVLQLSGYTGTEPIIDPMCGSGTFSLEGAMMAKHIPAGWFRDFAFMGWPAFRPKQWAYLKREAGKTITQAAQPRIYASDKDEKACAMLEKCILKHDLSDIIRVSTRDFFDLVPEQLTNRTGLVVINPPYGRRMGNRQDSNALFSAICNHLIGRYRGWKLALIAPSRHLTKTIPFNLVAHPLVHGGLKLTLLEGTIT